MSGSPANLGGNAMSSPPHQISIIQDAPAKKRGCGCLGSISGLILLVIAVTLLTHPWALHIGGRWTPALTWHGVGKFQSTSGAHYGLFMELYVAGNNRGSHKDFSGTAKICTPQGEVYPPKVDGYVKRAFFDLEGKQATFYLSNPKDARPRLNFTPIGSFQGQQLDLDDKGSMAMSFTPDGHAKGYLHGTNSPKETTSGSLHYATENEFNSVCGNNAGTSF